MLSKQFTKITPRLLEDIMQWGKKINRTPGWTKNDSKIYLLLTIVHKDMQRQRYLRKRPKRMRITRAGRMWYLSVKDRPEVNWWFTSQSDLFNHINQIS